MDSDTGFECSCQFWTSLSSVLGRWRSSNGLVLTRQNQVLIAVLWRCDQSTCPHFNMSSLCKWKEHPGSHYITITSVRAHTHTYRASFKIQCCNAGMRVTWQVYHPALIASCPSVHIRTQHQQVYALKFSLISRSDSIVLILMVAWIVCSVGYIFW